MKITWIINNDNGEKYQFKLGNFPFWKFILQAIVPFDMDIEFDSDWEFKKLV